MGRLKASQKSDEPRPFLRGRDVEGAGQGPGLVGHHADRHAAHAGQRRDEVRGPTGAQLEDVAVVDHGADHVAYVIGGRGCCRDQVAQLGGDPVRWGRRS